MKSIFTLSLVLIASLVFSQEYNFKPSWKKGTVKNIKTTVVEKEYENGELIEDSTYFNESSVAVIDENETSYTLEVLLSNQALEAATPFFGKLSEDFEKYKNLKLVYSVNKENGKTDLQNWEEVQSFMNGSFSAITEALDSISPDASPLVNLIFAPLKEMFSDKEKVEDYMQENVGFLVLPFGKTFTIGDSISETERAENPFNPMQELSSTTLVSLKSVDEASKTAVIDQEIKLDLSEFINMIKDMMMKMGESFGASDSSMEAKSKEFDDFEMDMKNLQKLDFNYETTWVTKVVRTAIILATDPTEGKKTRKEIIQTIEIN